MQPGQSLDAATLASLVETAIAHAALMAVAAAQDVELTAETLADFIAAHKGERACQRDGGSGVFQSA